MRETSMACRQAQEDALSLLAVSTPRYGATVMTQHLPKIWTALRSILSASGEFHLSADEKLQACSSPSVVTGGRFLLMWPNLLGNCHRWSTPARTLLVKLFPAPYMCPAM